MKSLILIALIATVTTVSSKPIFGGKLLQLKQGILNGLGLTLPSTVIAVDSSGLLHGNEFGSAVAIGTQTPQDVVTTRECSLISTTGGIVTSGTGIPITVIQPPTTGEVIIENSGSVVGSGSSTGTIITTVTTSGTGTIIEGGSTSSGSTSGGSGTTSITSSTGGSSIIVDESSGSTIVDGSFGGIIVDGSSGSPIVDGSSGSTIVDGSLLNGEQIGQIEVIPQIISGDGTLIETPLPTTIIEQPQILTNRETYLGQNPVAVHDLAHTVHSRSRILETPNSSQSHTVIEGPSGRIIHSVGNSSPIKEIKTDSWHTIAENNIK